MRTTTNALVAASAVAVLLGSLAAVPAATAETAVEEGKQISFDRRLGNCLACHAMEGGSLPGNIGPPLVAMKARFPDKAKLREQVWDPTKRNPNTLMPPFGLHGILTDEQIDKVVEFIWTL